MKKGKKSTIGLSEDSYNTLEKLSKKYKLPKSKIIEIIVSNITDTDLEKILLIPNAKEIFPQLFETLLKDN